MIAQTDFARRISKNYPQAKALLEAKIAIDIVIELSVSDDEIVKRLSGRQFMKHRQDLPYSK